MAEERMDLRNKLLGSAVSRRTFVGGTAALAASALLAACGGDDDDDEEPTTAPETEAEPTEADAGAGETPAEEEEEPTAAEEGAEPTTAEEEAEPTAAEEGSGSGVVRVRATEVKDFDNPPTGEPSGDKPDELIMAWGLTQFTTHGIDPQLHVGTIAENQLRHMYEPLVKFEADLVTISPCLATEWERLDDLTMQFKLREGVTYHNGEDFNADAVAYSVMRPLSDETPGDSRSTYAIIEEVEVVDDYTVNVKTSSPDPALLARMTGFHMNMVAPEWASQGAETVAKEAVGTGPYKFVSWSPNEDLVIEANEDYWGEVPSIKKVRLQTITEPATRTAALRSGEVHVAKDMPPEEVESINQSGSATAPRSVSNRVPFYFITVTEKPIDDPKVRQAINYSANVQGVIDAVLLGNGNRVSTIMAPWVFGFDPTLEPYPDDPEKAKALLEEAGYPDGIDIEIWFREGRYPKDREVAEAMAQQMGRANIRCTPQLRENAVLTDLMMANETPGLVFASWGNWFFDADNSFVPLFGCQAAADYGDWRRPYGCNQELEDVVQAARVELDEEKRMELYAEAQRILYDDAGALFMYQLVDIFGVDNWVLWEPRHDEFMWAHEMKWNE